MAAGDGGRWKAEKGGLYVVNEQVIKKPLLRLHIVKSGQMKKYDPQRWSPRAMPAHATQGLLF